MKSLLNDPHETTEADAPGGARRDSREDASLEVARKIVAELFGAPGERSFTVQYWNGLIEQGTSDDPDAVTLVLNWPGSLRRMFLRASELALGEAYVRGDFDIAGDVGRATALRDVLGRRLRSPRRVARLVTLLRRLPTDDRPRASPERSRLGGRRHTRERDASAIQFHYDVGNDFYALWLDEQRVYSCAYFTSDHQDLDRAQADKLDLICRKLRLQPGERFLDIGCGWGALVRHAVRQYGVEALGITISPSQADYARDRIAREGLAARCRVEVRDYRDLTGELPFDKVASIGMVEHVGLQQLPAYFSTLLRLTRQGGLLLNHGITTLGGARDRAISDRLLAWIWRSGSFIDRYVFPDSELVPLAEMIRIGESVGWEVRDAESLREHYARTLRLWVNRLEANSAAAIALVGNETYRIWRLNMGAAADAFSGGRIGVVQTLFARADSNGSVSLPWTRDDIYCRPEKLRR